MAQMGRHRRRLRPRHNNRKRHVLRMDRNLRKNDKFRRRPVCNPIPRKNRPHLIPRTRRPNSKPPIQRALSLQKHQSNSLRIGHKTRLLVRESNHNLRLQRKMGEPKINLKRTLQTRDRTSNRPIRPLAKPNRSSRPVVTCRKEEKISPGHRLKRKDHKPAIQHRLRTARHKPVKGVLREMIPIQCRLNRQTEKTRLETGKVREHNNQATGRIASQAIQEMGGKPAVNKGKAIHLGRMGKLRTQGSQKNLGSPRPLEEIRGIKLEIPRQGNKEARQDPRAVRRQIQKRPPNAHPIWGYKVEATRPLQIRRQRMIPHQPPAIPALQVPTRVTMLVQRLKEPNRSKQVATTTVARVKKSMG